jgi:hypothetical protein
VADNSGPNKRLNGPDGRVRNTSTSNQARVPGVPTGVKPPTVPGVGTSFSSVPGMAAGAASSWAALQNIVAAADAKRKGLTAAFKTQRAGIRQEAIGSMAAAIDTGIESGLTGSSNVMEARSGVLGQRRADIIAAQQEMKQGINDVNTGVQQQYMDYTINQQQMEMQAESMRQQAALAQQALDAQAAQSSAYLAALKDAATPDDYRGLNVRTVDGGITVGGGFVARGTPNATAQSLITALKKAKTPEERARIQMLMGRYGEGLAGGPR